MKKIVPIALACLLPLALFSQSVIIEPGAQVINGDFVNSDQMEVYGNGLIIHAKMLETSELPESNIDTVNSSSLSLRTMSGEAGLIIDAGGSGDYVPFSDDRIRVLSSAADFVSFKLSFDSLDIALGDSISISYADQVGTYSGSNIPASLSIYFPTFDVSFKSNADASVGAGFVLRWTTIFKDSTTSDLEAYTGQGLIYDNIRGSLWIGKNYESFYDKRGLHTFNIGWGNEVPGNGSMALGVSNDAKGDLSFSGGINSETIGENAFSFGNRASAEGDNSFATGNISKASGENSVAMGQNTLASGLSSIATGGETEAIGNYSTALGFKNEASGYNSIALGNDTKASDSSSIAIGYKVSDVKRYAKAICNYCEASGEYSTVLGNKMGSNDKEGTFMIGDSPNGATFHSANVTNRMITRFRNGYYFYTNATNTIGVKLLAGYNSWSTASDSTLKENFLPSIGEKVLNSVAQMRVGTWNYKMQDPSKYRHWGVMAQDFYKHFGKDKYGTVGSDTLIASADFDGVSFAAIKALEKRTRLLQNKLEKEKEFTAFLQLTLADLKEEIKNEKRFSASLELSVDKLKTQFSDFEKEKYITLKDEVRLLKALLMKAVAFRE
ncbi:MAG: hypothetical protein ACI9IP_002226 [Arcticibacterium sp.]|jgi:hypothetical protein